MGRAKVNRKDLGREARMVMHEDEHAIIKAMLWKALGDDDSFAMVVSSDRSASQRAEDRLVLSRFLERMERQFRLPANGRRPDHRIAGFKSVDVKEVEGEVVNNYSIARKG